MPKNTRIVDDHLAKYYARRHILKKGMSVFGDVMPVTMIKYQKELGLNTTDAIAFDLSPDDLKKYYDLIKEKYGPRFSVEMDEFLKKINSYAKYFEEKNATPTETPNEPVQEISKDVDAVKDDANKDDIFKDFAIETDEEQDLKVDEDKNDNQTVKQDKKIAQHRQTDKRFGRWRELMDEMRHQIKQEKVLFEKMKEKKEEIVQNVKSNDDTESEKPVVTSNNAPKFNWMLVLVGLAGAAVVLMIILLKKPSRIGTVNNQSVVPETTMNQVRQSMNSDNGIITAADLLSRMGV